MRGKDLVALGRVVMAKRERVIMLQAWEQGLLGTTLRYAYEIRETKPYFGDIPVMNIPDDMRTLAEHILDSKTTDFDPTIFVDRYEEAVVEMLKKKQEGMPIAHSRPAPAQRNVVDLMEALRRSLGDMPAPGGKLRPKANAKRRAAGQREMLLPIEGKGPAKEAAKAPAPDLKRPAKSTTTGRKAG
jgi:DNA end-binding protein Ku